MDYNHCTVYCFGCKDYVYDVDLERILFLEKSRVDSLISRLKGFWFFMYTRS